MVHIRTGWWSTVFRVTFLIAPALGLSIDMYPPEEKVSWRADGGCNSTETHPQEITWAFYTELLKLTCMSKWPGKLFKTRDNHKYLHSTETGRISISEAWSQGICTHNNVPITLMISQVSKPTLSDWNYENVIFKRLTSPKLLEQTQSALWGRGFPRRGSTYLG